MNVPVDRIKQVAGAPRQGRTTFRVLSFSAVAAVLAVLAFFVIGTGSAEASSAPFSPGDPGYAHMDAIGPFGYSDEAFLTLPPRDIRPFASPGHGGQPGESHQSASLAGLEAVWLARLSVGTATDSSTGYMHSSLGSTSDSEGLEYATFKHDGAYYVAEDHFLQNSQEDVRPLVFIPDAPQHEALVHSSDGVLTLKGANANGPQAGALDWPQVEGLRWR